jgi:FAD/FMN-containing dehydrogenase/ferredoxin
LSWSGYWVERARNSAKHQRQIYGLDASPSLNNLLDRERPSLGLAASLHVLAFIFLGHLRGSLRLCRHCLADLDTPAQDSRIESLAAELRERLSNRCRVATGPFERSNCSRDMARVPGLLEKSLYRTRPLLMVQPKHERDVVAVLAFAEERRIPVFPRGVSSSAFGASVPTRNGLVMDFSSMMNVLAVDPANLTVRVQPGVRWADLASCLERYGLAPITTPSSRFSTVAGWASTGGLGIDGFGYGHFSDAVAAGRVVLMNGKVLEFDSPEDGLADFLGTEGQLGIFTELTLRVRPKPGFSSPRLAGFRDVSHAFDFLDRLIARGHRPSHVVFYDRQRMAEENRLFADKTGLETAIVEEQDSVLLHFDSADAEREFLASGEAVSFTGATGRAAARYLWTERFFPMKAQRLGPGLLASEVVLPVGSVSGFVDRARKLAARFGIKPSIEVIVSRPCNGAEACVVIASFPCDPNRRWNYLLGLVLVQLLMCHGLSMHGRAYGLGIWNAPFVAASYPASERQRLLRLKQESDPHRLLNPNKFFGVRTRFFNIPGLFFRPGIFRGLLRLASALSPLLGAVAGNGRISSGHRWLTPSPEEEDGRRLLAEASLRCTSCGSCVSVCPAYVLTGDELVTGRSKLRMGDAWLSGREVQREESQRPFQCLHCGLCEEVCQTRLPLRECYGVLEGWIETRHGYPHELVQGFVRQVDADRELIRVTFGLDLPDWSPVGPPPGLREVQGAMGVRT